MSFFILFWGLLDVEEKLCVFIGIFQTYFLVSSVEKHLNYAKHEDRVSGNKLKMEKRILNEK